MLTDVIQYPYEILILELDDDFVKAKLDIEKNTRYPTIDIDALMDNLFDIIQTTEAYNSNSRQDDIDYLLQETIFTDETQSEAIHSLRISIDVIINSVLAALHKTGCFINGLQPYSFSRFFNERTIILSQSKVFSFRDEQHPPLDTVPRRDFLF